MVIETPRSENEHKLDKNNSNEEKNTDNVEYDELLSSAGELGKYQILLFLATCPFYFYGVVTYYGQIFLTEVSPKHWCWIPELENLTEPERIELAIPPDENGRFGINQCYQYVADWMEVLTAGLMPNATWETAPCQNGWEFDRTGIPYPTISSELGWVCNNESYQASAQTIAFVGCICGGFLIGWISDRYGRLPALISSCMFGFVGGIASTFATNFVQFAIFRFITGISYDNCTMMAYLIVLEYVAPKYRSLLSNLSFATFYCFFCVILPWIALASGHWKIFSLVTSIPMGLAILTPLFLPESPRWLLSKGRVDEAIDKSLTIARVNKKVIPVKLIEQFKSSVANQQQEQSVSWLEILKTPVLRRNFIIISLLYMSIVCVFDGLVRSISHVDFNFFVMFTLISATELPSMLLVAFILDRVGRRWMTTIVLFTTSIFTILSAFITSVLGSVMSAVIARFAVNMSYSATIQWTPELLPTAVRGSGAAVVHICGFVGTLLSPFIVYSQIYVSWLPSVIIGIIAACGGILALFLPETAGVVMPQTFDDAIALSKKRKFWDMPCLRKKNEDRNCNEGFHTSRFEQTR